MNVESAWKLVVLMLALFCCAVAWISCALSGGDLLECVLRGAGFFALVWVVLSILGVLLRAVITAGGNNRGGLSGS